MDPARVEGLRELLQKEKPELLAELEQIDLEELVRGEYISLRRLEVATFEDLNATVARSTARFIVVTLHRSGVCTRQHCLVRTRSWGRVDHVRCAGAPKQCVSAASSGHLGVGEHCTLWRSIQCSAASALLLRTAGICGWLRWVGVSWSGSGLSNRPKGTDGNVRAKMS